MVYLIGVLLAAMGLQPAARDGVETSVAIELREFGDEYAASVGKYPNVAKDRWRKFLKEHPLSAKERAEVYRFATTLQPGKKLFDDPQWDLVCDMRDSMAETDVAVVREVMPKLGKGARAAAIVNLSKLESRAATRAMVECALLLAKEPTLEYFSLGAFHHTPRNFDVIFPAIHQLAEHDVTAFEYFAIQLKWAERGLLPVRYQAGVRETAMKAHRRLFERLRARDAAEVVDAKKLPEDDAHGIEGEVFDLLGKFQGNDSVAALREGMTLKSTELRLWAAASLLELRQAVSEAELEAIAADMEFRYQLLAILREKGVEEKYPKAYRSNRKIAEAHFMDWLKNPSELGQAPQKLELAKSVVLKDETGEDVEYFVFKFLPTPKPDEGPALWQMGASGPYLVKGGFDPMGGGDTFSDFHQWDEAAVEKEVQHIRERVAEVRKQWEKMKKQ